MHDFLSIAKSKETSCGSCNRYKNSVCEKHLLKTAEVETCDFFKATPVNIKATVDIVKVDLDQHMVFGWAYVSKTKEGEQVVDHSGDVMSPEELEKASYEYVLTYRQMGGNHEKDENKEIIGAGDLIECIVFTAEKREAMGIPDGILPDGVWVGYKIYDEDVWEKAKSGEYKMLSIGLSAISKPVQ